MSDFLVHEVIKSITARADEEARRAVDKERIEDVKECKGVKRGLLMAIDILREHVTPDKEEGDTANE